MERGRVIVVGAVNVDLVVAAIRLPVPGQTVTGEDVVRYPGGKGGNQSTAAARLGARVAFIGAVGRDDMGNDARAALAAEGIDLGGLLTTSRTTGVALIVVDSRGENIIAVASGANGDVHAPQVQAALERLGPRPADVLLASREIPADGVRAALEVARSAGSTTILNPAPADGIDPETLALADVLTPNETELALLVGSDGGGQGAESSARQVLAGGGRAGTGPRTERRPRTGQLPVAGTGEGPAAPVARRRAIVVTLGAAGALVVRGNDPAVAIPAPAVTPIDTTGAGDTFNGALAAALADGRELADAVRHAVAAAALSTTRPGARGGMPTQAQLESFLANR